MINPDYIKGIIFDYGGTIDSNGLHWAEVIWEAYEAIPVPVSKEAFREAYVHGERALAKNPLIKPTHTFKDMMHIKIRIQRQWLLENNSVPEASFSDETAGAIADRCYDFAKRTTERTKPVLNKLWSKYPLVLVSNFYGNIESVLKDFELDSYFNAIVESAVVGVRKPDPEIFRLGVKQLNLEARNVLVIGDSYDKDIVPASTIGCPTVWIKNIGWKPYKGNETADWIITDFSELENF